MAVTDQILYGKGVMGSSGFSPGDADSSTRLIAEFRNDHSQPALTALWQSRDLFAKEQTPKGLKALVEGICEALTERLYEKAEIDPDRRAPEWSQLLRSSRTALYRLVEGASVFPPVASVAEISASVDNLTIRGAAARSQLGDYLLWRAADFRARLDDYLRSATATKNAESIEKRQRLQTDLAALAENPTSEFSQRLLTTIIGSFSANLVFGSTVDRGIAPFLRDALEDMLPADAHPPAGDTTARLQRCLRRTIESQFGGYKPPHLDSLINYTKQIIANEIKEIASASARSIDESNELMSHLLLPEHLYLVPVSWAPTPRQIQQGYSAYLRTIVESRNRPRAKLALSAVIHQHYAVQT